MPTPSPIIIIIDCTITVFQIKQNTIPSYGFGHSLSFPAVFPTMTMEMAMMMRMALAMAMMVNSRSTKYNS